MNLSYDREFSLHRSTSRSRHLSLWERFLCQLLALIEGVRDTLRTHETCRLSLKVGVSLLCLYGLCVIVHQIDIHALDLLHGFFLASPLLLIPWFCFRNEQ